MIRSSLRSLRPFAPQLRRSLVALSAISTLAGLVEAGVLVIIVRVLVTLTESSSTAAGSIPLIGGDYPNSTLLIIAGSLGVLALAMHLLEIRVTARLGSEVVEGARNESIDRFNEASWERQSLEREGALQETVTTLTNQSATLTLTLANCASALINLVVLLGVALVVDPVSTVVVVIVGSALFLALRPFAGLTRRRATEWTSANSKFAEDITSLSTLALEFRVFGRQNAIRSRLRAQNHEAAEAMRRMRIATAFGGALYRDIALLLLVVAVGIVVFFVEGALFSVGAVALLVLRSVAAAQRLQANLQAAYGQAPALVSLRERLEVLTAEREPPRDRALANLAVVELRNVSYEYEPGVPALADVDLRLESGETLGVVGPSGGGKSTLAQVLVRLRPPTSGTVTIDGCDYREHTDEDFSRLVSFVPQEPHLLEDTVEANIRFLRDGYSDDDVRGAAARAHVLADLEELPQGLATVLGPRGGGLSGGQRQRLTIARALLGMPQLLVLDEPTSALDVKSEQLLGATIRDLKTSTTMVIIAHRPATLEACDRLAVVSSGRIEMIGTSEELLAQPGFFSGMFGSAES